MIIGWRVWYEGPPGSGPMEFDSNEILWEHLPEDGLLALRTYEDEAKPNGDPKGLKLAGLDYYFMADGPQGLVVGADNDRREINVSAEIAERYPGAVIRRGRWTDSLTMQQANDAMQEARSWP